MEGLSRHRQALVALSGDTLFHVQAEVICRTLDVIDEVTDRFTAFRIADAIAARWGADADARLITEAEYRAWAERRLPLIAAELTEQFAGTLPEGTRFAWMGEDNATP